MGMIAAFLVFLGTVLSKLLADEAKAWLPNIIEGLVRRAVGKLPEAERERFGEEWRADLNETPGDLSKLMIALSFQLAAMKIRSETEHKMLKALQIQRILDLAFAVTFLVAVLPIFAVVGLLCFAAFGFPVLYWQNRIGLNGRPFRIYKFRTMTSGDAGPTITNVGAILRKTSLDELPQLFNVLYGDVSFVGPNLMRPEEAQKLLAEDPEAFEIRPGLISIADQDYMRNPSVWGYFRILIATIMKSLVLPPRKEDTEER